MATDSNALIQALVDGGISPAASKVIANALANATTPQFSQSRDVADATPTDQLRLINADTRRYVLTNLDYSSEAPYQKRLSSKPGQYTGGSEDHPYKDSQPIAPVPPLSTSSVQAGNYVSVDNTVQSGAPVATVGLNIGNKSGTHMRLNQSTYAIDAVDLQFSSPQGLVTASVDEEQSTSRVNIVVRELETKTVVQADGTSTGIKAWPDSSVEPTTVFTEWAKGNLLTKVSAAEVLAALGIPATAPAYTQGTWTPALMTNGTQPVLVYSTADTTGKYVRIGNLVWITGRIIISSVTSAGSGILGFGNLPYPVAATNANLSVGTVGYRTAWVTTAPGAFYFLPGSSNVWLTANSGTTVVTLSPANFTAGSDFIFSGWYLTA